MNKQELIEKYEGVFEKLYVFPVVTINEVLEDLKQLDEPKEKVTIPRPVANWISCVRGRNKTLHFALENAPEEVNLWFCEDEKNRQNIFANAWVNGYHIEKEKRYRVKIKTLNDYLNETELFKGKLLGVNAKIDEIELMQSTGLKDKNGKEIFEGDVIAIEVDDTETPINARVSQNSKIGVLMFHVFEDNEDVPMVELLEDNSVAFEIIGNVYENPELLEVE